MQPPEVHYARSGDVSIAYQVVGDGPIDLVFVAFMGNLAYAWEQPLFVDFYERLASFFAPHPVLGLELRAGLHTGERELVAGKVGGIAVHIGARVPRRGRARCSSRARSTTSSPARGSSSRSAASTS